LVRSEENLWYAKGNNLGASYSTSDYLVFLNEDTVVDPLWLQSLSDAIERDHSIAICQPKLLIMEDDKKIDAMGSFFTDYGFLYHEGHLQMDSGQYRVEMEVLSVKGACFLIRRDVFEKVGRFDEDYVIFFEESDLCWRVWLAGYRVVSVPTSIVLHRGVQPRVMTREALYMGAYGGFRNRMLSLLTNLDGPNLIRVLPMHATLCAGLSLLLLARGRVLEPIYIIKAILSIPSSLPRTMRKRIHVQDQLRNISDHEFLPRLTKKIGPFYFAWLLSNYSKVAQKL
jgi:GT2 family glycosyltransferase